MYERNAIVIDRYFSNLFGYEEKSNLKNNYTNYCQLVSKYKEYQEVTSKEDNIILEVEKIANEIKEIQNVQESFYKRTMKLQETRKRLFDDLDEDASDLKRKFDRIEEELEKNNIDVKNNEERFISQIAEFNTKSVTRSQYGKERRIVESDYRKIVNYTNENFSSINQNKISDASAFLKQESKEDEKQKITSQILKNGLKEKVPFNEEVITKAIDVATEMQEKRLEILLYAYDRTGRVLNEIKAENVKIDRHQKFINDANSKLALLNAVSEYIVLFLDNERMNVVGGIKEHKKLMDEACENFEKDMVQINNMYDLLLKEISGKTTKKIYKELYNPEYLLELLKEESNFEKSISKLNVMGTVIYPNYWRVEGMQKIYDVFKNVVSEDYGRDLSEFEPEQEKLSVDNNDEDEDTDFFDWGEDQEEENEKEDTNIHLDLEDDDWDDEEDEDNVYDDEEDEDEDENIDDEDFEDYEDDINEDDEDKTIDEILGFYDAHNASEKDILDDDTIDDSEENDIDFDWEDDDDDDDDEQTIEDEIIEEDEEELIEEDEKEEKKKRNKKGFFNKKKQ